MKTSTRHLKNSLMAVLRAGVVPYIMSSPGMSKSAQIAQLAKENKLKLIDIRLAQCEPSDLNGLPFMNHETNKAQFFPFDMYPLEGQEVPDGYNGWLLLLDELGQAPVSVQSAAFKLILDRQVGMHNLHPKVAIVAAGNLKSDKAGVSKMSTALQSRMAHFELEMDHESWIDWANQNEVDHRIISYINFNPKHLHNFNPNHTDYTFACPRTWEFLSNIIKNEETLDPNNLNIYSSVIGEGVAREFYAYTQIFEDLPTIKEIIANPFNASIGNEKSAKFAITGLVSSKMTKSNSEKLMQYLNRLPVEFQIICMKGLAKRTSSYYTFSGVAEWSAKIGHKFL